MKIFYLLAFLMVLIPAKSALAEGNCPPGYYPIGASNGQAGPQGCAPIPGYGNHSEDLPDKLPPNWESRWLAVATDAPNGVLGTATNLRTRDEAERMAFEDCVAKGGTACEISLSLSNGCAALAAGKTGFNVRGAETEEVAKTRAMQTCNRSTTGCAIYYTACSPPVRIR